MCVIIISKKLRADMGGIGIGSGMAYYLTGQSMSQNESRCKETYAAIILLYFRCPINENTRENYVCIRQLWFSWFSPVLLQRTRSGRGNSFFLIFTHIRPFHSANEMDVIYRPAYMCSTCPLGLRVYVAIAKQ